MKKLILSIVLLVALVGITQAATVFEEDFESYTDGSVLADPPWTATSGAIYTRADSGSIFSPSNMYVDFLDDSTASISLTTGGFNITDTVCSISFDIYEPTSVYNSSFNLRPASDSNKINVDLRLSNGNVVTSTYGTPQNITDVYTLDALHHVDVVANLSANAVEYYNGESVAGYTYDVWIDRVLVIDDVTFRDNPASTNSEVLNKLVFNCFSSHTQQMYLDNIVLRDDSNFQDTQAAKNTAPASMQIDVPITQTLSWDAGIDTVTGNPVSVDEYYVYIGGPITDSSQLLDPNALNDPNLPVASGIVTETGLNGGSWAPPAGFLSRDNTYVWRVDEKLSDGTIVPGYNGAFTTVLSIPVLDPALPADTTVDVGEYVELTVDASNPFTMNSDGLSYQWMYAADGVTYSAVGTDSSTLAISSAQISDQGYYYCVVTIDSNGKTEVSRTAQLIVKQELAHWTLDQADYVNGVHLDMVGGHDADPNGEPLFVTGAGPDEPATGATLIDSDTYAPVGTWAPSETTGQFTVSAWIKWDGTALNTSGNGILCKGYNWNSETMWMVRIRDIAANGNAGIRFYNASGLMVISQGVITPNTWMHVTATYGSGQAQLYINGELAGKDTAAALGTGTTTLLTLGAGGNATFPGDLDEVMIHNYAMSNEDAATLYYQTSKEAVCLYPPVVDLNDDCKIDLLDFAIFAKSWFDCGLVPVGPCSQ